MLNKVLDNHAAACSKLSFEEQQEIINAFFALFYGGREELICRLTQLKDQSYSDQEIFEMLKNETNLDFWLKVSEIIQLDTITGVIKTSSSLQESADELMNLITDHDGIKKIFEMQKPLAEYNFKTVFNTDLQGKNIDECKERTKGLVFVTKETIAKEFECNKRTLSKWLREHFGNRFSRNNRKITINEYIEIFEAFFLSEDENLDLNNDLDKYLKRVEKGMSFSKSDLAWLCSSDLKTQKGNLKKIAFYSSINKFPYSKLKEWALKMGYELEF
ncbi:hypothetical protein AAEO57_09990 [Flavobacterium sp. DGU38]|uniref:Uncharacterized protein n=1 Tax=Flavobacterium calami TaxID=3139144 RepID=A0ABU9INZ8_9FLAO